MIGVLERTAVAKHQTNTQTRLNSNKSSSKTQTNTQTTTQTRLNSNKNSNKTQTTTLTSFENKRPRLPCNAMASLLVFDNPCLYETSCSYMLQIPSRTSKVKRTLGKCVVFGWLLPGPYQDGLFVNTLKRQQMLKSSNLSFLV